MYKAFITNGATIDDIDLVNLLLDEDWHTQCEIIPDYMPPFPREDTRPSVVVRHNNGTEYPAYLRYSKLTDAELAKKKATVLDEPFVRVAKIVTDPTDPAFGGIVLDWNKAFPAYLEEHGYGPHPTEDETVNEWFNELCKNVALDAFDGTGDFTEKMQEATERPVGHLGRRNMSEDVVIPARAPTKDPEDTED